MNLVQDPATNIKIDFNQVEKNLKEWQVKITSSDESIYLGEEFCLQFRFSDKYPFDSPEVTFLKNSQFNVPIHPHVYR